jgi:hypothetical protein
MDEDDLIKAISANKLIMEALTLNKIEPGIAITSLMMCAVAMTVGCTTKPEEAYQKLLEFLNQYYQSCVQQKDRFK